MVKIGDFGEVLEIHQEKSSTTDGQIGEFGKVLEIFQEKSSMADVLVVGHRLIR
jgi:hypothetical protein